MDMSSSSTMSTMNMVFTVSSTTPLWTNTWTPHTTGQYAGTCIFLILFAMTFRGLLAAKHLLELYWLASTRDRRYVHVRGAVPVAERIEADPDAKQATLVTANGVEENVKVVRANRGEVIPFRLSVDVPRACLTAVIVTVGYMLMLAVMTMNVGYFLSVVAGAFVGELLIGRYAQHEEH